MRAGVEEVLAQVPEFVETEPKWDRSTIKAALELNDNEKAIPNWIRRKHNDVTSEVAEIIQACIDNGCDLYQTSYILATARHESVLGLYKVELGKDVGVKYEGRKSLGNTVKGDGPRFIGRGYVQLTGRRNYTYWMKRLKLPLLSKPHLVEQPEVAAQILVQGMMEGTFTGAALPKYVQKDLSIISYRKARKTVNGMDKAQEIAEYAEYYQRYLNKYFNPEVG